MVWDAGSWWMHGPGFGLHGLGMLVFWGLLVLGLVLLLRAASGARPAPPPVRPDAALDALRERYARGELTPEEYRRLREALR